MRYALREAIAAFRRAPVLTGLAAAMVGLALFVLGLFGLVAWNLQAALRTVEARVEVVAYLRDDATTEQIQTAIDEIESLPEVEVASWVSKDEALEKARADLPDFQEVFTGLDVNPLPSSLEIRLSETSRTSDAVERVAEAVGAYPFVEEATYGGAWVERLFSLRRIFGITAGLIGAAFAMVAALIIGTALRIAIFARRDEIYIMRLVGAKDGFIRGPFILEGAFTGLLGGGMALLTTWLAWRAFTRTLFPAEWLPTPWIVAGLVAGVVFGALASSLAVRRHLREV